MIRLHLRERTIPRVAALPHFLVTLHQPPSVRLYLNVETVPVALG